jgi:hypothetical protein
MDQPILLGDEPGIQRKACPPCNGNCHQAHDCPNYTVDLDYWPSIGLAIISLSAVFVVWLAVNAIEWVFG